MRVTVATPCAERPRLFDVDAAPADHAEAVTLCAGCPIRLECVTDARRTGADGIRAGLMFVNGRPYRIQPPILPTPSTPLSLRPCGTHAAFVRHRNRGEEPCWACWQGERDYQRNRKRPGRSEVSA